MSPAPSFSYSGSGSESSLDLEKKLGGSFDSQSVLVKEPIDLSTFHEKHAGRLVLDPEEARVQYGDEIASRLKLTEDGKTVLWPQPTDSSDDPQNWSARTKSLQLFILIIAAIASDLGAGVGIADLFSLADEFHTTTTVINDVSSNWAILLAGWGGIVAALLMSRYGRLPVLFWTQFLSFLSLVGCTFAPTLPSYSAMKIFSAFFATSSVVAGLLVITDMYPFHLQASKLSIWSFGFLVSPYVAPFAFGFLVSRANWRWTYGIVSIFALIEVLLIALFMQETMYDRGVKPIPPRPSEGLRYRVETLLGITGFKMARYRPTILKGVKSHLNIVWRPQMMLMLVLNMVIFCFGIGINVTTTVFLGQAPPFGFGLTQDQTALIYITPIVATIIGEVASHYTGAAIQAFSLRRNRGVFLPEHRLWVFYFAIPLFIVGLLILGAGIQYHLTLATIVIGWGLTQIALMLMAVPIYGYLNDSFSRNGGEVSALIGVARTLGGFVVPFFQVPWAMQSGALVVFGVEAAVTAGVFLLVVPLLQIQGASLRERFSVN